MDKLFLPVCRSDVEIRGWSEVDIILVTGDAYVDHPSYGAAVIGRALEAEGYKVGVIAQPDWRSTADFKRLGRPRLFFGVTAGNLDSMIANYTASMKPRKEDEYSPGGKAGMRPDRAVMIYTNRIKEAFQGVPVVIGGLEAGMRRFAHYDYWSDRIRGSILADSKADMLVYGMGEKQVVRIAELLSRGENIRSIDGIKGTAVIRKPSSCPDGCVELPSLEEIRKDKIRFNEALKIIYAEADPHRGAALAQKHGDRFVVQFPPPEPLTTEEIDRIYTLPYVRSPHPSYTHLGGIPGFETVRFSVISHRGCCGGCNFCSLYLHQGRMIQSRSERSILNEVELISKLPGFKGTITDIGGPTANMYMAGCKRWAREGVCANRQCIMPEKCDNLILGYEQAIHLWNKAAKIPGIKHVFTGSGLRYDLLIGDYADKYMAELCKYHISGRLKVAPEHTDPAVLKLMNKPPFERYEAFVNKFEAANKRAGKKQFLVNYIISSHPGCGLKEALEAAIILSGKRINPEQIQDFIPLPMTFSSAMYYTGKDPVTGRSIHVARAARQRKLERSLIQHSDPANRKYVIEALRSLGRMDLAGRFLHSKRGKVK